MSKRIVLLLITAIYVFAFSGCSPVHQHTAGEPVEENRIEPTCEKDGSYDLVTYCVYDDEEISSATYHY